MSLQAGFAEIDITPPVGTQKIGWKRRIVGREVLDPLAARVAVLTAGEQRIAWVQLDTLCIRARDVARLRRAIEEAHGFPGANIMVAATHNHAGPAVASLGDSERDEGYLQDLIERCANAFGAALGRLEDAEVAVGHATEFGVAFNRRVVMRDGTVRTHGTFTDPDALCLEGPIDPELAVLAVRNRRGESLGALVNFACHPTHHGGDEAFSAGFPGALADEMKRRGCPVLLFLNGAAGNVHTTDLTRPEFRPTMEDVGRTLADGIARALEGLDYRDDVHLACASTTLDLPYRTVTEDEIQGRVFGAQRFIDTAIYDREIPPLVARIRAEKSLSAEIQVFALDEFAFVAIPAEYFCELGLRVKEATHPVRTLIVGYANGMIGYVPHREAFARGGYETTFCGSSKLAPEAGDLIADAATSRVSGLVHKAKKESALTG